MTPVATSPASSTFGKIRRGSLHSSAMFTESSKPTIAKKASPVALEDTIEFGQRPKVDPYEGQLLLVFFTARVPAEPLEIHIYISGGFIATVRHDGCDALDGLHDSLAREPTHDEEVLVYRILDGLTDAFF